MYIGKLILLQLSAIVASIIGSFLAPDKPLYPFAPTEIEYDLIIYKELHIDLVIGFVVLITISIMNLFLKISNASILIVAILTGILFGSLESWKVGTLPQIYIPSIVSYLCGSLAGWGLASLFCEVYKYYETSKNT